MHNGIVYDVFMVQIGCTVTAAHLKGTLGAFRVHLGYVGQLVIDR